MAVNPHTTVRKLFTMPHELAQAIADYRFRYRIKSEAEAIRRLIEAGLKANASMPTPLALGGPSE